MYNVNNSISIQILVVVSWVMGENDSFPDGLHHIRAGTVGKIKINTRNSK